MADELELRVREFPRISVNKLAEYLTATPTRRRRIIQDQKRPPIFQVALYTEATRLIGDHLASVPRDEAALAAQADRLRRQAPRSDFDELRAELCAEAIEAFLECVDLLELDGLTVTAGEANPEQLLLGGIPVSVRPEAILRGRDRAGRPFVGALKLALCKGRPLGQATGEYVATALEQYVTERLATEAAPCERSRCVVLDVFAGERFLAPRFHTRRRADLVAACEEIAGRWSSVALPPIPTPRELALVEVRPEAAGVAGDSSRATPLLSSAPAPRLAS